MWCYITPKKKFFSFHNLIKSKQTSFGDINSLTVEESTNERKTRYSYKTIYTRLKRFVEITRFEVEKSRPNIS